MLVVKSKESERHTQPAHTQACIHPPPGGTTTHTRAARTAMAVHPGMAEGKRKEESVSCIQRQFNVSIYPHFISVVPRLAGMELTDIQLLNGTCANTFVTLEWSS